MPNSKEPQIYYIKDVKQITGRSASTLRRWWESGNFPKPTKLPSLILAWNAKAVHKWIDENIKKG